MEQIQFLTYIMAMGSLLLSAFALWLAFRLEDKIDKNVQILQNQISMLRDSQFESKNGRR